jgi:hypothetical protein
MCTHASHVPKGQDHAFPLRGTTPPRFESTQSAAPEERRDRYNLALVRSSPPMQGCVQSKNMVHNFYSQRAAVSAFVGGAKGLHKSRGGVRNVLGVKNAGS